MKKKNYGMSDMFAAPTESPNEHIENIPADTLEQMVRHAVIIEDAKTRLDAFKVEFMKELDIILEQKLKETISLMDKMMALRIQKMEKTLDNNEEFFRIRAKWGVIGVMALGILVCGTLWGFAIAIKYGHWL